MAYDPTSWCLAPLLALLYGVLVVTAQDRAWCDHSASNAANTNGLHFKLTAMGASIVYGFSSSDGNGFRGKFENLLQDNGTLVDMVGTQESGEMKDNHHEAYPGVAIADYNNKTRHSGVYAMGSNVFALLIGTNDCWYRKDNETGKDIAGRFGQLLDSIHEQAPDALILAAELITSTNDWADSCIRDFNQCIPDLVTMRADAGQQVRFVPMYDVVPLDKMSEDGTHPTDQGYSLMAHRWYEAARNATSDWCIPALETEDDGSQKTKESTARAVTFGVLSVVAAVVAGFALL